MKYLVGYTGFVGSNIALSTEFDGLFNSKNINEAFRKKPDLLVYSGIPAQKFIANSNQEKDLEIINNAIENIRKINPKEIILISTIDIYKEPVDVNEDTVIDTVGLEPYGYDRYMLEKWVMENFEDYLIVRLPGLYGENLKKNFIYDLINVVPQMLSNDKYNELVKIERVIGKYYLKQDNGFYKLVDINDDEKEELKKVFKKLKFSALNFTDSRGKYQFYNLKYLWNHIEIARNNNLKLLNLATEPITVAELYEFINNSKFVNELDGRIPNYNYKTKYDKFFNGENGYIFNKDFIKEDIKKFVEERTK